MLTSLQKKEEIRKVNNRTVVLPGLKILSSQSKRLNSMSISLLIFWIRMLKEL